MASNYECGICLDDFKRPKIISCFHTFCEKCLDDYIKSSAHLGKFKCPMCTTEIIVPANGAASFTNNFYIEERCGQNACPKHRMELTLYCRTCSVAICFECLHIDHADHKRAELKTVDPELRQTLKTYQLELRNQIEKLENHSDFLNECLSKIDVFAITSHKNVSDRIEKMCQETQMLGHLLHGNLDILRDKEKWNIKRHKVAINKDKTRLQTSDKCSVDVLKDKSTIGIINILPSIKTLAEDHSPLRFCNPVVKYFGFPKSKVDTDSLKHIFGDLQTMDNPTFTTCFNIDKIKADKTYWSPDYYIIQGLPWHVGVIYNTDKSVLSIHLNLKNIHGGNVKSCIAQYSLKLVSRIHDSKSPVHQCVDLFTFGGSGYGWLESGDWNHFIHPRNGFLDNNNDFRVQATVEIRKVCFVSKCDLIRADTDMCYTDNHLVQLEDLYWRVGVKHHQDTSTLGVYLKLAESKINVTFCTAIYTLKLVHTADSTKSVEKRNIDIFIPGGVGCGWHDIFDWNKLIEAQNGFQVNDQFTIEATVEVNSETFTETVDLEDIPTDHARRGQFYNIRYLPWCLGFRHYIDKSTLGVYLSLFPGVDKTVKTCSGKVKLKLIHPTNSGHSVIKEVKHTFVPYYGCLGSDRFIDWNDLKCRFVDGNKFAVQATITVIDIDRY